MAAPSPVPPSAVWPAPSRPRDAAPIPYPLEEAASASGVTLRSLRSQLRDLTAQVHREAAKALSTLAGEDVPEEAMEALLSHDHFSVFRELAEPNPLLGAIFEVFEKVAAEILGGKLRDYFRPEEISAAAKQTASAVSLDWRPAQDPLTRAKREQVTRLANANRAVDSCRQTNQRENRRLIALDLDLYTKTRGRAIERAVARAREQTIFLFVLKPGEDQAFFTAKAEMAVSAREDKELDDIFRIVPPRERHRRMKEFADAIAAGGKAEDSYWQASQERRAAAFKASEYEQARQMERELGVTKGTLSKAYETQEQREQRLYEERLETIKSQEEAEAIREKYNRAFAMRMGEDWDPVKGFIPRKVTFLGIEVPESVALALEAAEHARVP